MAAELGRLDIGQCVVVKGRVVVAVEAIEGTDACIKRGWRVGRQRRGGGKSAASRSRIKGSTCPRWANKQ